MQQAETNWQERFEHLSGLTRGCANWDNSFIEVDAEDYYNGKYLTVLDENKVNKWGNKEVLFGGYVPVIAWKIANGFEVRRPIYILNDDMPKYLFYEEAFKTARNIKEKGDHVGDMYHRFGCPKCGNKDTEHLQADGDSEADGCSADWAVWCHWSYWCEVEGCDWSMNGQYVTQSGGW